MLKRFFHNTSGSALVELALTAPLLLGVLIGTAELGRIAYYAIEVQNAARAGAAYGAQSSAYAFGPASNIKQAADNDVSNITDLTFPTGPTTACVCESVSSSGTISYSPTSGTALCSTMTGCNRVNGINGSTTTDQPIEYVVVNTQVKVKPMFNYPGIPSSFTLSGVSQMRVIQN